MGQCRRPRRSDPHDRGEDCTQTRIFFRPGSHEPGLFFQRPCINLTKASRGVRRKTGIRIQGVDLGLHSVGLAGCCSQAVSLYKIIPRFFQQGELIGRILELSILDRTGSIRNQKVLEELLVIAMNS
jgi:hypothetical protein